MDSGAPCWCVGVGFCVAGDSGERFGLREVEDLSGAGVGVEAVRVVRFGSGRFEDEREAVVFEDCGLPVGLW